MSAAPQERPSREQVTGSIQARVRSLHHEPSLVRMVDADVLDFSAGGFGLLLSTAFVVAVGDELVVDLPDELDEGTTHRVKVAWIRNHELFAEVGVMKLINEQV